MAKIPFRSRIFSIPTMWAVSLRSCFNLLALISQFRLANEHLGCSWQSEHPDSNNFEFQDPFNR